MPYLEWREHFSVGYAPIDVQHRQIIELINYVYVLATRRGDSRSRRMVSLNALHANLMLYTRAHFAYEEALLQTAHYESYAEHEALHRAFTRKTAALARSFASAVDKPSTDLTEALHLLKQWWSDHILTQDQLYTAVLHRYHLPDIGL